MRSEFLKQKSVLWHNNLDSHQKSVPKIPGVWESMYIQTPLPSERRMGRRISYT